MLVTLCGDLREELPVLFLRLREAVVEGGTKVVEIGPASTALSPYAAASWRPARATPPLVARALTGDDAAVTALARTRGRRARHRRVDAAPALAGRRGRGHRGRAGRGSYAEAGEVTAEALRRLAAALPKATFLPALRRGNVFGALDMGLSPGSCPGRVSLEEGRRWFARGVGIGS